MSFDGDTERQRLLALLDEAARASRRLTFWWRDDDAEDVTPELDRLLRMAGDCGLPLGLAVVPNGATEALAARIADAPAVVVLQHGWSHKRHNPPDEKKAELGDHRPVEEILLELGRGRARLQDLFGKTFLPVLVPPWNRISDAVRARRRETGLTGLSTFGAGRGEQRHVVNTHVDLIDWTTRAGKSRAVAFSLLAREIERRAPGDGEPIGLLTHHLVQDEPAWLLLDEILGLLARHSAARWPGIGELFGFDGV